MSNHQLWAIWAAVAVAVIMPLAMYFAGVTGSDHDEVTRLAASLPDKASTERVDGIESRVVTLEAVSLPERMTRLETQMLSFELHVNERFERVSEAMRRIEVKLDELYRLIYESSLSQANAGP